MSLASGASLTNRSSDHHYGPSYDSSLRSSQEDDIASLDRLDRYILLEPRGNVDKIKDTLNFVEIPKHHLDKESLCCIIDQRSWQIISGL